MKIHQKKEETFRLIPLSLPSLNCKAYYLSRPKKEVKNWLKKPKNDFFRAGTLCCALRNNN